MPQGDDGSPQPYGPDNKPVPSRQPHPEEKRTEPNKADTKQQNHVITPPTRAILEILPEFIKSQKSDQHKNYWLQKRQTALATVNLKVQKRIAKATIGAFAAAVIYAAISFGQWYELRNNFKIDERAWIQVKVTQLNAPLSAFVKPGFDGSMVTNVGKTPARVVTVLANSEIIARDKAPSFNYSNGTQETIYVGILFQGQPSETLYLGSSVPITDAQRTELASGRSYLVVYATVD